MEKKDHCFIERRLEIFLKRFSVSYFREDTYNYYYLRKINSSEIFSKELVLTLNEFSKEIHVSKFYPEIKNQPESKYLSASCFYLLIQHFSQDKKLEKDYHISLNSRPEVFKDFYVKLDDFEFIDTGFGLGRTIAALSETDLSDFDAIPLVSREHIEENELFYI